MKAKTHLYLLLSTIAIAATSCAPRIPFTQAIKEQYKLDENDLKSIQFFTSGDIVLTRGERITNEKGTQEGTLIVKGGKELEEVVIRAGTPGVIEKVVDENKVAVSFESDGSFLIFGDASNNKDRYSLLAAKWNNNRGKLKYGDQTYFTSTQCANVYLMFKMKRLNQLKKKERIAKGRKL